MSTILRNLVNPKITVEYEDPISLLTELSGIISQDETILPPEYMDRLDGIFQMDLLEEDSNEIDEEDQAFIYGIWLILQS